MLCSLICLKMYYINSICFICLSSKTKLSAVFHKQTNTEVQYVLPELTILNPKNPVYICSSCHTTLRSYSTFKKKCLDNYNRLNDYITILQESNATPDQSFNELQIRLINCEQLIKQENGIDLNIEEKKEDALMSTEGQYNQKIELDDIKEESLASEDGADGVFYQLLKIESVLDDIQDGGNNASDEYEINSNIETNCQEFHCLICKELFTDRLTFDSHLRNHISNITGMDCLICDKKCSKKQSLLNHIKFHLGIKDFKCSICKQKFVSNGTLKMHMNLHKSVKNYECSICKKKFTYNCNLKLHIKIHEGRKDFECSICKKKFSQKTNLKRHIKIHERT